MRAQHAVAQAVGIWVADRGWLGAEVAAVLAVALLVAGLAAVRGPTGRSFVAVRDSELSARCLGVNVEWVKIQAFGISAAITGLAGALLAHHLTYLAPDVFGVLESLKLLLMIVIAGISWSEHSGHWASHASPEPVAAV